MDKQEPAPRISNVKLALLHAALALIVLAGFIWAQVHR